MRKKVLKITGILVLLIILLGFWGYNRYLKPDPEIGQQLNNQFGEDFFTSFGDQKTSSNSDSAQTTRSADNQVKEQGTSKEVTSTEKDNMNADTDMQTVPQAVTQDEISNKYKSQFNHLQNVALSRIDTLYSAAIQEYVQNRNAGTLNRAALVQKYLQAGNRLEANVDDQFYSTLNIMEADLKANNLPTDIVGVYKNEYESAKAGKRAQLLTKSSK